MIPCASLVILLFLLRIGTNSMSYKELMSMLFLRVVLDLFNGIEMFKVIFEENEVTCTSSVM